MYIFRKKEDSLCRDILMRKFLKVLQVFTGTTEGYNPSLTKNLVLLSWLLIKIITWWGDTRQIGTSGVSDMAKRSVSLSEINFTMAGYLLCTDLIFAKVTFRHLDDPGFGLISPASRSKMKRREGDRAGRIYFEDFDAEM